MTVCMNPCIVSEYQQNIYTFYKEKKKEFEVNSVLELRSGEKLFRKELQRTLPLFQRQISKNITKQENVPSHYHYT